MCNASSFCRIYVKLSQTRCRNISVLVSIDLSWSTIKNTIQFRRSYRTDNESSMTNSFIWKLVTQKVSKNSTEMRRNTIVHKLRAARHPHAFKFINTTYSYPQLTELLTKQWRGKLLQCCGDCLHHFYDHSLTTTILLLEHKNNWHEDKFIRHYFISFCPWIESHHLYLLLDAN